MKTMIDSNLAIEPVAEKHLTQLMELVNTNRPYLREWLTWLDFMKTPEDFKHFISGSVKRNADGLEYSCMILDHERIIGRIGLYYIDRMNRIASIGYWIAEEYQGRGIASRACELILKHGFENLELNRIEIKCGTGNSRSQAIPKRLGFQREGIIRQGELLNGRFVDLYLYAMLKDDWENVELE